MATAKKTDELSSPVPMYRKLWSAKQQIGKVHKNAKNPHFKQSYADLNAVLDACEQILLDNGLMILQPVNDDVVITQIIDVDSGEKIESFMRLPALTNPQQLGSAISYYRRYSLVSLLTLASTDDDGAEAAKNIPQKKPAISETGFTKALTAIAEGRYTKEDLMTNYSLTTDQLAQL
jgi:hypothetical protein